MTLSDRRPRRASWFRVGLGFGLEGLPMATTSNGVLSSPLRCGSCSGSLTDCLREHGKRGYRDEATPGRVDPDGRCDARGAKKSDFFRFEPLICNNSLGKAFHLN